MRASEYLRLAVTSLKSREFHRRQQGEHVGFEIGAKSVVRPCGIFQLQSGWRKNLDQPRTLKSVAKRSTRIVGPPRPLNCGDERIHELAISCSQSSCRSQARVSNFERSSLDLAIVEGNQHWQAGIADIRLRRLPRRWGSLSVAVLKNWSYRRGKSSSSSGARYSGVKSTG